MKFCSKCGTKLLETQKFCAKCGTPINDVKSQTTANNNNNTTKDINSKKKTISQINNSNDNSNTNFNATYQKPTFSPQNHTTPKKPINKLFILIPTILVVILVAGVFITKFYLSKKYTPASIISQFQNCVINKDANSLKDILYSLDASLKLDEKDAEAIIKYLSEDPSNLDNVMNNLNNDSMFSDNLTTKGSPILLSEDELFALTISDKNFLFTKYKIMIKPLYLEVYSNELPAKVYIKDTEVGSIADKKVDANIDDNTDDEEIDYDDIDYDVDEETDNNNFITKVGPIAPGSYDVTLKTTDVFGNELAETLTSSPIDILEEKSLNFFNSVLFTSISTNVPEASIFINGQDTGKIAKDYEDNEFGPVRKDDIIQLVYTNNDVTYKTREKNFHNINYQDLDLDFSYIDYEKIQSALSGNSESGADYFIEKHYSEDYIINDSNNIKLSFKDTNNYTIEELFIARNELFARHGYVFKNSPKLQSYFESKSWYIPNETYSGNLSGNIEESNLVTIRATEFLKMSYISCEPVSSDYVFPNSNTMLLSDNDVASLSDWELIIARNEIYARYGLNFSINELVEHFRSRSWYNVNHSVGNNVSLNSIESQNVATILKEENKRMDLAINHDLGE